MKKFSFLGILMVLLVLIGCTSYTPKGDPSPFEGRWMVDHIEEPGRVVQNGVFPYRMVFEKDRFSMLISMEQPNGTITTTGIALRNKFKYTNTEIIISRDKTDDEVFKYTLQAGRLTTIDELYGTVVWVSEYL